MRSWQDLKDEVEKSAGKPLRLVVERGGMEEPVEVEVTPTLDPRGRGVGVLGVGPKKLPELADVREDSYYAAVGLRTGDQLLEVGGPGNVFSAEDIFLAQSETLTVKVSRNGENLTHTLTPREEVEGDIAMLGITLSFNNYFRRWGIGEAISDGLYEPVRIGVLTFQLLGKLILGEESVKDLAGPVGIFKVSIQTAEVGFGNFLWLMALITVNLGIFNLLPIPILDGGHVVLLVIEKFRGRPPSEGFIIGFQYVGLIFLLALILFVTYNDILGH